MPEQKLIIPNTLANSLFYPTRLQRYSIVDTKLNTNHYHNYPDENICNSMAVVKSSISLDRIITQNISISIYLQNDRYNNNSENGENV